MIFHYFCDTVSTPVVEGQPGQKAETVDQRACPNLRGPAMPRECATMPDSANPQPRDLRAIWMLFTANRQSATSARLPRNAGEMQHMTAKS